MRSINLVLIILCVAAAMLAWGCSYAPHGVQRITSGFAIVDRGVEKTCRQYVESYEFIEDHCKSDAGCMKYWDADKATLDNVEFLCGALTHEAADVALHAKRLRAYESELDAELQKIFKSEDNIKRIE